MPDTVHHALALGDQGQIQIRDHQPFAFGQRRGQMSTFRRDDRRETAARKRLGHGAVRVQRRLLFIRQPAGGVNDERRRLGRMMPDCRLDLVREHLADHRTRKLGDMDFLVLRHEGVARQWVVVFPAGPVSYTHLTLPTIYPV